MSSRNTKDFKGFLKQFSRPKATTVFSEIPPSSHSSAVRSLATDEEILARGALPDYIRHGLDLLIVGINPGFYSAKEGHYYAGPGNHFWKCLYQAQLVPEPISWKDDHRLLEWNIGLTNICARATRGQADLSKTEIEDGAKLLAEKIRSFQPKMVVFNGKGIYEIFIGGKIDHMGQQPSSIPGIEMFVMPSSSPRSSLYPTAKDKLPFYVRLKELIDSPAKRQSIEDFNDKRFRFEATTRDTGDNDLTQSDGEENA